MINNLSADTTYYFKIRTGNGCAPGQFSDIISTIPNGEVLINPPPPIGFQSTVLGAQNSIPPSSKITSDVSCSKILPFAFLLAIILNLILIRSYFLLTILISFLSLIFDYYLNQHLCLKFQYFYINNLLSFLIPFLFSLKKSKT